MYEAHIWYRVSRNPCHTRQAHQTWLRPRQKIKICCSIVCSRNLQCACNNNKNGAEQQDLGQISATHRHEDAKCVPVELLMCKVVITKWGLPACCMECTYSACVTLFASICSTDIVKPNDYSRRHKKNAMSRKSPLKYVAFHLQHVALRADLEVSILKKMSRFAPRTEGIISSASRFVRQEQHCFLRVYVLGCVWKQASIYQFCYLLFVFCSRCYKNQYYCIYCCFVSLLCFVIICVSLYFAFCLSISSFMCLFTFSHVCFIWFFVMVFACVPWTTTLFSCVLCLLFWPWF